MTTEDIKHACSFFHEEIDARDETIASLQTELNNLRTEYSNYRQLVGEQLGHLASHLKDKSQLQSPPGSTRQISEAQISKAAAEPEAFPEANAGQQITP